MSTNSGQELEFRLQRLYEKKSSGDVLETASGSLPDLRQLQEAWADLDNPALYPPKLQDQERLRTAYEAYEVYGRIIKVIESCLEKEVSRLEPILLMQQKDLPKESEELERGYMLAKELRLTGVAYRFQVLLEDAHAGQHGSHPIQKEGGVRLEGLHERFKGLIKKAFEAHTIYSKKKAYLGLLEKTQTLKRAYEQIGCSVWGSHCGGLVKLVERRLGRKV
ncbi:MAG: hypothetical protein AABX70_00255 [Nanoarchaeota archaeon]